MKIFIGLENIAGIIANYDYGFRKLGHETFIVVRGRNKFYPEAPADIILDELPGKGRGLSSRLSIFHGAVRECDLFIFLFGTSFLPFFIDYPLIKKNKKKLVSTFWGTDIRFGPALRRDSRRLGFEAEIEPFLQISPASIFQYLRKIGRIKSSEWFADLILAQGGYGQLLSRPYMRANVPIHLERLVENVPGRSVPLVVHAPSKRGVKGTEYVLQAVEKLKREGIPFEFQLIENMPNRELLPLLSQADIVVDELFSETIGVLSSEAMASGCVSLVRYDTEFGKVPPGCPAVNTNCFNIEDHLREMIVDRDKRVTIAKAGRAYVAKHNDAVFVCQQMLTWLMGSRELNYDYRPRQKRSSGTS